MATIPRASDTPGFGGRRRNTVGPLDFDRPVTNGYSNLPDGYASDERIDDGSAPHFSLAISRDGKSVSRIGEVFFRIVTKTSPNRNAIPELDNLNTRKRYSTYDGA